MSRRGVGGYSSLQRHLDNNKNYSTLSDSLAQSQTAALQSQLATFQSALTQFSTHHRAKILSSPQFRAHFSQLCAQLGVDPLGGGQKGIWDKMGLGDWYFALGVQIVDVCLRARERAGGLVALDEVIKGVTLLRRGNQGTTTSSTNGKTTANNNPTGSKWTAAISNKLTTPATTADISPADVARAIEALGPLGCGYAIIEVGGKKVVRCAPGGMDTDSLVVVEAAGEAGTGRGAVTMDELIAFTRDRQWPMERVERALEKAMMEDGMVWIDEQANGTDGLLARDYYVPALFEF